mgnify:CR=1 FL=1
MLLFPNFSLRRSAYWATSPRAKESTVRLSGVMNAARSLALKMADSFYDGERTAQTDLVNGLINSATDLLNTTYDDIHVFGGHQSSDPPYEIDGNGAMVYNGDSGQMQLDLSDGGRGFVTVNPEDNFNGNGGGENILQLLIDLRDQMQANSQAGVGATLNRFELAVSQLSRTASEIGTHYQQIDVHDGINEVQDVELERLRSTIEDTNYAEAATNMTMRQTAYQASLAATARVQSLSLLSFMR